MSNKSKTTAILQEAQQTSDAPREVAKSVVDANGVHQVDISEAVRGSKSDSFNSHILRETIFSISTANKNAEEINSIIQAAAAAIAGFKPKDEIEGMLAAQAVALHFGAMEALRRSMIPNQPSEIASKLRKDGANLARAMTDMIDALDRKRGKGPQVVRVERVVVNDGGQAIVGTVNPSPKV